MESTKTLKGIALNPIKIADKWYEKDEYVDIMVESRIYDKFKSYIRQQNSYRNDKKI